MIGPYAVIELIAFWPLVIGVATLLLRNRLATLLLRRSKRPVNAGRKRATSLALLFGALIFVVMGVGGFLTGFLRPATGIVISVTIAIALVLSFLAFWWAVRAARVT